MAIRQIRIWPDPALCEVARRVEEFDARLSSLAQDMFQTMYAANGVGLAGPQIAVALRIIVVDLDPNGDAKHDEQVAADLEGCGYSGPLTLINPELLSAEGTIVWEEGCLSLPGITEDVKRANCVVVRSQDLAGESFDVAASGLFAVALQHEIDHLNGAVFVDHISRLKRESSKRKMNRLKASGTTDGVAAAADL